MTRRTKLPEIKPEIAVSIYRYPSGQWMIDMAEVDDGGHFGNCSTSGMIRDEFAFTLIQNIKQLVVEYRRPKKAEAVK